MRHTQTMAFFPFAATGGAGRAPGGAESLARARPA
jgi:hypothetical protein